MLCYFFLYYEMFCIVFLMVQKVQVRTVKNQNNTRSILQYENILTSIVIYYNIATSIAKCQSIAISIAEY